MLRSRYRSHAGESGYGMATSGRYLPSGDVGVPEMGGVARQHVIGAQHRASFMHVHKPTSDSITGGKGPFFCQRCHDNTTRHGARPGTNAADEQQARRRKTNKSGSTTTTEEGQGQRHPNTFITSHPVAQRAVAGASNNGEQATNQGRGVPPPAHTLLPAVSQPSLIDTSDTCRIRRPVCFSRPLSSPLGATWRLRSILDQARERQERETSSAQQSRGEVDEASWAL